MKFKKIALFLTAVVFFITAKANAQSDTSKLTSSHLALAEKLISTTGMTDVRFSMMRSNTIKAISQSVPEKNREKFSTDMAAFMNKYLPQQTFKTRLVHMYAELFTENELNQLIDFYNSPLGKKITLKTPELMQKALLMDHEVLVKHSDELQSIYNEAVKE